VKIAVLLRSARLAFAKKSQDLLIGFHQVIFTDDVVPIKNASRPVTR
jgi:hypothetical protein